MAHQKKPESFYKKLSGFLFVPASAAAQTSCLVIRQAFLLL